MNIEMESPPNQKFFKTPDLAKKLNLSIRTIERMRKLRIIPYIQISRKIIIHDWDKVIIALLKYNKQERKHK